MGVCRNTTTPEERIKGDSSAGSGFRNGYLNGIGCNRKLSHILGLKAFLRLVEIELDVCILIQNFETLIRHDSGKMDENIFPPFRVQDKSIPFFAIKPLYFTFSHSDITS